MDTSPAAPLPTRSALPAPSLRALDGYLADLWDQYRATKPTHYSRLGKLIARIRQVEDAIGALVRADPGPFI